MKRQKCINCGLLSLIFVLVASVFFAGSSPARHFVPDIPAGWNEIDPAKVYPDFQYNGLTPACSNSPACTSDKFSFFVKKGKVNKVLVYFQGGGACWDPMNCLYYSTYTMEQTETLDGYFNNPDYMKGVFDTSNPKNPFKDWFIVYIPNCTGDLFVGANDFSYPDYLDQIPGVDSWTIQHRGFVNFQVVLKWMKDNFVLPWEVFLAGSSAGGYGATINAPHVTKAFPFSVVHVLSDGANGVIGDQFDRSPWKSQLPEWVLGNDIAQLTSVDIFSRTAAEYPFMRMAQYTSTYDGIQVFFYNLQINDPNTGLPYFKEPWLWSSLPTQNAAFSWHTQMLDLVHDTAAATVNYRYYIGAGKEHTILMTDNFYTEQSAGGVSFVEWVREMANSPRPLKWKNAEVK